MSSTEQTEQAHDAEAPREHVALSDSDFKQQLTQVIPHLRAFGRSLSGSRDVADDLVQETLLKAWAARQRFQAGTNMRAWTFIILRNLYLSQMRRARFKGEWDDLVADRLLAAPASQDRHVELTDMQRALLHLPRPQREALILVGAGSRRNLRSRGGHDQEPRGARARRPGNAVERRRAAVAARAQGGAEKHARHDHGRSGRP
jgi:RNA polymerase sigma factor (sigma-70 family)